MAHPTFPIPARRARGDWFAAMAEWLDRRQNFHGLAWRRAFAYLVDAMMLVFIGVLVKVVFLILGILSFGLLLPLLFPTLGAIPLLYHTLLIGGPHGATLGMRLFDVEMRSWTGEPPEYLQAFATTVLFYSSAALTCGLILLFGLFNRRRRLLHDLLCGLVAVRSSALDSALLMPPPDPAAFRGGGRHA